MIRHRANGVGPPRHAVAAAVLAASLALAMPAWGQLDLTDFCAEVDCIANCVLECCDTCGCDSACTPEDCQECCVACGVTEDMGLDVCSFVNCDGIDCIPECCGTCPDLPDLGTTDLVTDDLLETDLLETDLGTEDLLETDLALEDAPVEGDLVGVDAPVDGDPIGDADNFTDAVEDPCGNGACDPDESCVICAADCGECLCEVRPAVVPFEVAEPFAAAFGSPPLLGTAIRLDVAGQLASNASNRLDDCKVGAQLTGQTETCVNILGEMTCLEPQPLVADDAWCGSQLECLDQLIPLYSCSLDFCCQGSVNAALERQVDLSIAEQPFGPLSCSFGLTGAALGGGTIDATFGANCNCADVGSGNTHSSVSVVASGAAECTLRALGQGHTLTAQFEACTSAQMDSSEMCGSPPILTGGTELTIEVPDATVGWLTVGGYSRTWTAGGGCAQ